MRKSYLLIIALICTHLSLAQGTQIGTSPLYYNSGSVNVGGNNNNSLYVRHLYGKKTSTINADNLYLNYNTGKPVYIGFGGLQSNLNLDGKLGIGTTSPQYALDIQGTGAQSVVRLNNSGAAGTQDSWIYYAAGGVTKSNVGYRQSTDALTLRHYSADRLVIKSNGNVGIGTTTPDRALVVNGRIGFDYGNTTSQSGIWRNEIKTEYYNNITGVAHNVIHEFTGSQGVTVMSLTQGGNVGIGTTSPSGKVHIMSNPSNWVALRIGPEGNHHSYVRVDRHPGKDGGIILSENGGSKYQLVNLDNDDFSIYSYTKNDWVFAIQANTGNIGIGTTTPTEKLEVAGNARIVGNIYSKKVKVTTNASNWPDYVFESDYQLTPLSQLEAFVKTNKHLPEVPSAKEVEANGQDLGDIQARLLKKVEELTLYVIEQDKKRLSLEERMKKLEAENAKLKALLKKE